MKKSLLLGLLLTFTYMAFCQEKAPKLFGDVSKA